MNIDTISQKLKAEGITHHIEETCPTPSGIAIEPRDGEYIPDIQVHPDGTVTVEAVTEDGDVLKNIRPYGGREIETEDDVIAALEYVAELTGMQLR